MLFVPTSIDCFIAIICFFLLLVIFELCGLDFIYCVRCLWWATVVCFSEVIQPFLMTNKLDLLSCRVFFKSG